MTQYSPHEVAISDADRAEIEAFFIELMRERKDAAQAGSDAHAAPASDMPGDAETQ